MAAIIPQHDRSSATAPCPGRRRFLAGAAALGVAGVLPFRAAVAQDDRFKAQRQAGEAASRDTLIADLVFANHILANEGVLDAFGHVSIRDPDDPDRYIMSRTLAPALVTVDALKVYDHDLKLYDRSGKTFEAQLEQRQMGERFIHAEIYRARPDVGAVVHSHTPAVIPFADTGVPLKAMLHMASFLYKGASTYEIRDVAGDGTNLLVNDHQRGEALAKQLGEDPVILMRGHGMTVVGSEIREAVYRAIFTEANAEMETRALAIAPGKPIAFLSPAEGALMEKSHAGEATNRAWFMWKAKVAGK